MNWLQSLVDVTVAQNLRERTQLLCLVARLHGHVGTIPVTHHAEPFEVLALTVDLLHGVFATSLAKLTRRQRLHFLATRLLDLMLDRQAMTVPAGNVGRVVSIERSAI